MKISSSSISVCTQFSLLNLPNKAYNSCGQALLHKNLHLRTVQLVKCLSTIGFIGCVIGAALFPAIMCGSVAICAHLIKNRISKKNVSDREVKDQNVFHELLRLERLSSEETSSKITKYSKIALLLVAYSCISQLVDSCRKESPSILKDSKEYYENLGEYCSRKIDSINRDPNIKEIHESMTRIIRSISINRKIVPNANVISEAIFKHTPAKIMKMISELCNELAEEEASATKQIFKEDAEIARNYAEKLTVNPTVDSIRISIRESLIESMPQILNRNT